MTTLLNNMIQEKQLLQKNFIFFLVAILPPIIGWYIVGADNWDLSIPFVYGMHDDVWQLLLTKGLIDNGWVLQNKFLGAPDIANWHYHAAAQTSAIHSIIMKGMSFFINDAVAVQQYYYFLNFSLISSCTYIASRLLKISTLFSIAIALIFTFITFRFNAIFFAFLSNYFMVPLAIVIVVWCSLGVFTKEVPEEKELTIFQQLRIVLGNKKLLLSLIIIFLTSISDGYYAFFTVLLLGFSSILVIFNNRYRLIDSLIPIFLVTTVIAINFLMMLPINIYKNANFNEFNPNGVPDPALVKHPMEAEVYSSSLKLMLAPITNHRVAEIAEIGKKIVQTNDDARKFPILSPVVSLGTIASFCFIFTLTCLALTQIKVAKDSLFPRDEVIIRLRVFALLSLFIVFCSISGGIGTIIALVYPTIRAYDRFPLFLIFCVLATFSFWLSYKLSAQAKASNISIILTLVVIVFALWDQSPSTAHKSINEPYVQRYLSEREFIQSIESNVSRGAMIYQYPYSQYLDDNKYYGHGAFSHMRPYLHSKQLRWSNGASKNSSVDIWHSELANLPFSKIISEVSQYGFEGILIDLLVLGDEEFNHIKRTVKSIYGIDIELDKKAKLAFFRLPNIGYKMLMNSDYTMPASIEVTDQSKLDYTRLPSFIDKDILKDLLNKTNASDSAKFDFEQYPELYIPHIYNLLHIKLDEKLDKSLLKGDLYCSIEQINVSDLNLKTLKIRIHNNSDVGWRLNSGTMPLTIGYHMYRSDDGEMIEWDNGYRYKINNTVNVNDSRNIELKLNSIGLNVSTDSNFLLEFELLQEGNAWFGVNKENKTCRVNVIGHAHD